MSTIRRAIAFVFALFCVCACSTNLPPPPTTATATDKVVAAIDDATVALISYTEGNKLKAFCTGVWVDPMHILTAAHCVEDEDIGEPILFVVHYDEAPFFASLLLVDKLHDLALLHARVAPPHTSVRVAREMPERGTPLHLVGHTKGLVWSYFPGWVAAYRSDIGPPGSKGFYMQVSAPVSYGDSGAGAFSLDGELVGITAFITGGPNTGFCVPVPTIRTFLSL